MDILNQIESYEGLKLKDVVFNKGVRKLTATFLYNPNLFVVADRVEEIESLLRSIVPDNVVVETKFIRTNLDKANIALFILNSITNNFPSLAKNFSLDDIKLNIDTSNVQVDLYIDPTVYDFVANNGRERDIENKLKDNFFAEFKVILNKKADFVGDAHVDAIADSKEFNESIKFFENKVLYKIFNVNHIVNKVEYNMALDFSKVNDAMSNCVVCGTLTKFDKRTYTRKTTRNGRTTEQERIFYTFSLMNDGKFLSGSIFPRIAEEKKCEVVEVGRKVAMFGKFDNYKGRLNFTADSLCVCDFEKYVPPVNFKHVNQNYHTIIPEPYEDFEQGNMFGEENTNLPKEVLEQDYVVFDFETTGLESAKDEIIEIGAVKISKGKIVSTFSTFVKPSVPIPAEITELTHITEDMVADAPAINYVLPDFYKYCYGCALVAQNIAFDYGFLSAIGKKMLYNFDNPQYDTMIMARNKLRGLKNYKLGTICDYLGVSLVGAHRAVNDCLATAKVFLKLV
ncbi:MAG: hypothetical protein IJ458_02245 [Clostridia bacterium]|nr:hypothetical protein [Clostridia bacterium]